MSSDVKSGANNVNYFPHVQELVLDYDGGSAQISVPSLAINYTDSSVQDGDFKDRVAFQSTAFTDETKALESLSDLLSTAEKFIAMLYSYRSCSKALPMVQQDTSEADKTFVHRKTFDILRPEILKLKELMIFHEKAVQLIRTNLQMILAADQRKDVQSDALQAHVIKSIDVLILLDALKDMRTALLNDFSRYKRAFTPIRNELEDSDTLSEEIHTLQMFLSNPQQPHNLIIFHLKTDVQKIQGYDTALALLINFCCDTIEKKTYLLPSEYHTYYRVMPYLLYLMDSDDKKSGLNVFKYQGKTKFDLARVQKLFKTFPVMPLYMDMHIDLMFVLKRCAHFEEEKMSQEWLTQKPVKLDQRYLLVYHRSQIRKEYLEYTATFTAMLNEIKTFTATKRIITPKQLQHVFNTVLDGLRLLSSWSSQILEQCAYKCARPKNDAEYKSMGGAGGPGSEYEKAVKYNYSPTELYALIDVIGMVKGLGGLMINNELIFVPLIRRCIHDDIQVFLQSELALPLHKAHKRNRQAVKNVMLQMREIGCDWIDRESQKDDYLQKEEKIAKTNRDFPRRATAPTLTQINLIRRMMHTIFDERAAGMQGGIFTEKDLKKEWLPAWEEFYSKSFFYTYMLNFSDTVREIIDLSHLWYREFYLEVTKAVQFPIGMSMPWIMTEFLIKTPSMKENIFFPMDIYNDAASEALYVLKQQFLYDEIQAELNLSFEQLIFHLSEDIFKYFKSVASSILINKPFEVKYYQSKQARSSLIESRYASLMNQHTIQLLGRSVDLAERIGEQVNDYLKRNIDMVIRRFEAAEFSSVVEFSSLLENVRMTHLLLSDYLPLDDWESMFREINEDVAVGNFRGRVVWHMFTELVSDVFPNFVYNESSQRFVRGRHVFVPAVERSKPPSGITPNSYYWYGRKYHGPFDRLNSVFKGYVGAEHIEAMLKILPPTDLPLLIHELVAEAENKLILDFGAYAKVMIDAIPQLKMPAVGGALGIIGAYGFFDVKLRTTLGNYPELRPGAFQAMREFGNNLLFIRALETALNVSQNFDFLQHSHFQGIRCHPPRATTSAPSAQTAVQQLPFVVPDPEEQTPVQKEMRNAYTHLTQAHAAKLSEEDQGLMNDALAIADEAARLYTVPLEAQSLFTGTLAKLSEAIARNVLSDWRGSAARVDRVLDIENPRDIARLLSCLTFIFCQPMDQFNKDKINDMEAFGDGWQFAVTTILHLSGLRRRFELTDLAQQIFIMDALQPIDRQKHMEFKSAKDPSKVKMTDSDKQEVPILEFLASFKLVKYRNDAYFQQLNSYFPVSMQESIAVRPPTDESQMSESAFHRPASDTMRFNTISAGPGQSYATLRGTMHGHTPSMGQGVSATSASFFAPPPPPM